MSISILTDIDHLLIVPFEDDLNPLVFRVFGIGTVGIYSSIGCCRVGVYVSCVLGFESIGVVKV